MVLSSQEILSIVSILITGLVGTVLYNQNQRQKELIDSLTKAMDSMSKMNQLFDPVKLGQYLELMVEKAKVENEKIHNDKLQQATLAHEKKVQEEVNKTFSFSKELYLDVNKDFGAAFEELISIPIGILIKMNNEERENQLKFYPKSGFFIKTAIEAFEKGHIKPNSNPDASGHTP
ncbi:hypothetical protein HUW51_16960 [Adhaeribacter swui]|uniref:Uncharacterized protein n=1 Tax=Adhaeribacter swui TaxID=2086471 RepID=A0A7G7GAZ5_9BACT|nr:hypothetical protein [Adhaeribacter swui]QNF34329.1 hypothetical protein HUW51_16960 [Adhaeribacter swui]